MKLALYIYLKKRSFYSCKHKTLTATSHLECACFIHVFHKLTINHISTWGSFIEIYWIFVLAWQYKILLHIQAYFFLISFINSVWTLTQFYQLYINTDRVTCSSGLIYVKEQMHAEGKWITSINIVKLMKYYDRNIQNGYRTHSYLKIIH